MHRILFSVFMAVFAISFSSCHKQNIDDVARQEAASLNQQCPLKVDEGMVNDSVAYDAATHTFTYYYTLSGAMDADAFIASNKSSFHSRIESALRNAPELDPYIKAGISFHYVYHSQTKPGLIRYEDTFRFQ